MLLFNTPRNVRLHELCLPSCYFAVYLVGTTPVLISTYHVLPWVCIHCVKSVGCSISLSNVCRVSSAVQMKNLLWLGEESYLLGYKAS
jgi:hypothetical protein